MFVCLCLGVTDREINAALVAGARSVDQVGRLCGAGTCCGGCRPEIARMIAERCPGLAPVRDIIRVCAGSAA